MNRPAFLMRVAGIVASLALLTLFVVGPVGARPALNQTEPTARVTPGVTPSPTGTHTPTYTPSPTVTPSPTATPSPTVTPSPTPVPYLEVTPSEAEGERKVSAVVRGRSWSPNGIVTLYWDGTDNEHRLGDSFLANINGTFQVSVTVKKAWATVGTHTIYARETSGLSAQTTMTLLAPPPSATPTPVTPTSTFTPSPTLRAVTPEVTNTPFVPQAPLATSTPTPVTATATQMPSTMPTLAPTRASNNTTTLPAGPTVTVIPRVAPNRSDTPAPGTPSGALVPGARERSVSWIDGLGNLWVFGGYGYDSSGSTGYLNDLWRYEPISGQWTWTSGASAVNQVGSYGTQGTPDAANVPGGRYGSVSWIDGFGRLWLFGGYGYDSAGSIGYLNDLWQYDPINGQWTWVSGADTANQAGGYAQEPPEASSLPGGGYGSASRLGGWGNLWSSKGQSNADSGSISGPDAESALPDGLQPSRPRLTAELLGMNRR
jgi:hypothetical protein